MIKNNLLYSLLAVLMLVLLLQLHWSGKRLLAETMAHPALVQMERWDDADIDPRDAEWEPVRVQLFSALQHMPEDPELLASFGDLYTQRLSDDYLSVAQTAEAVVLGSEAYLMSLAQRPTWVRDWDDLALIKYNQKLYDDDDFQLALRHMARFGQHRNGMMSLLTDMSAKSWDYLTPETRKTVTEVIEITPALAELKAATEK
jgi:hypothetical protein